jgi:hypothetical protein
MGNYEFGKVEVQVDVTVQECFTVQLVVTAETPPVGMAFLTPGSIHSGGKARHAFESRFRTRGAELND